MRQLMWDQHSAGTTGTEFLCRQGTASPYSACQQSGIFAQTSSQTVWPAQLILSFPCQPVCKRTIHRYAIPISHRPLHWVCGDSRSPTRRPWTITRFNRSLLSFSELSLRSHNSVDFFIGVMEPSEVLTRQNLEVFIFVTGSLTQFFSTWCFTQWAITGKSSNASKCWRHILTKITPY